MKHVRTREEIIFDKLDPPVVLPKGAVFGVTDVVENGIILVGEDGEPVMIDLYTFEAGFEALSED